MMSLFLVVPSGRSLRMRAILEKLVRLISGWALPFAKKPLCKYRSVSSLACSRLSSKLA